MRMTLFKVMLSALLCVSMIGHSVAAVDLWSEDLWGEPSKPQTPAPPPVHEPSPPTEGNAPSTKPTGSGLWSEDLWKETDKQDPPGADINPKPVDPKPLEPKPAEPAPVDPPLPDDQYAVVMQVENNTALVRGQKQDLPVPPTIINGRMMVPLRFIGEALGAAFTWSGAERKITMELDARRIELWVGKQSAVVDDRVVQLDTPPVILNASTLVPVRFVSENLGYELLYEAATRTVRINVPYTDVFEQTAPEPTAPEPKQPDPITIEPEEAEPSFPQPAMPDPTAVDPEPVKDKPILTSTYDYFGTWTLEDGNIGMGSLTVKEDGSYSLTTGLYGTVTGTWRQGEKGEIPRVDDLLILLDGPDDMDWAMVPRWMGSVSVRYHYLRSYSGGNKIWFEYSTGTKNYN